MTSFVHLMMLHFLNILLIFLPFSSSARNSLCANVNHCLCALDDESVIDLRELAVKGDRHAYLIENSSLTKGGDIVVYFNPCQPVSNHCAETSCSLCLYNRRSGKCYSLGSAKESTFIRDGADRFLSYNSSNRITKILLKCRASGTLFYHTPNGTYDFHLDSEYSCPRVLKTKATGEDAPSHLSTGSVLVIILVVLFSAYFFGGMLVLKCIRGAEGREMIPNYDFWMDLPFLVRDGMLFILSGCQPENTYERI